MNRIEKKFKELKRAGKKAFVAFVTAGDPNLKATPKIVTELAAAGADIIELGMPFSDPMADGPVIQRSSERALKAGTTLKGILQVVRQVRKSSEVPILLMGYFNPVFHFGVEKFFGEAKRAGVDGVLLVDLPPDEGEGVRKVAQASGLSLVFLLAPTSDAERIRKVTSHASGFLYYVSMTGITGAKLKDQLSTHKALKNIKKKLKIPLCIGFGVKGPDQAKVLARLGDGVVVGSALVQTLEKNRGPQALARLKTQAQGLARAIHSVRA